MKNKRIAAVYSLLLVFAMVVPVSAQGTVEEVEPVWSAEGQLEEEFESVQSEDAGVVVTNVVKNSPAERAGIRRGDIILTVNGTPADSVFELRQTVSSADEDQTLQVELLRGEEPLRISLDVEGGSVQPRIGIYGIGADGMRPARQFGMIGPHRTQRPHGWSDERFNERQGRPSGRMFGLYSHDMPEELTSAVAEGHAARITQIIPGSPADDAGLTAGTIMYRIDGNEVTDGNLREAIFSYRPGDAAVFSVYNGEHTDEFEIVFGENEAEPYLGVAYHPVEQLQFRYGEDSSRKRNMPWGNHPHGMESWRSPGAGMNGRFPR
ncbi:MAG: PDZ domain-containing protein [Spirochaetota bacterium]